MELSLNRNQLTEAALKALHLIDLTSLNDDDTEERIAALAASADTPVGTPAALCVYPRFVGAAHAALARHGLVLPVATVTNFPHGAADPDAAARETADALRAARTKSMWCFRIARSSTATNGSAASSSRSAARRRARSA